MMTLMPALPMASTTWSIQAYSKWPSSGSQRLQVDSPMRTTLMPASFIMATSFSRRAARRAGSESDSAGMYSLVGGAVEDVGLAGGGGLRVADCRQDAKHREQGAVGQQT